MNVQYTEIGQFFNALISKERIVINNIQKINIMLSQSHPERIVSPSNMLGIGTIIEPIDLSKILSLDLPKRYSYFINLLESSLTDYFDIHNGDKQKLNSALSKLKEQMDTKPETFINELERILSFF